MKTWHKWILALGVGLLTVLFIECFAFFTYVYPRFGWKSVPQIVNAGVTPDGKRSESSCNWQDDVRLHPYVGAVWKERTNCVNQDLTANGFTTHHPLPKENPAETYDVLVLGGSVAETMGTIFFEDFLQKNFTGPQGQQVRVRNGAMTGDAWPHTLNKVILFGHLVDAVVLLDGFNEAVNAKPPAIFGTPAFATFSRAVQNMAAVDTRSVVSVSREIFERPLLRYSYVGLTLRLGELERYQEKLQAQTMQDFGVYHQYQPNLTPAEMLARNARAYGVAAKQFQTFSQAAGLPAVHFMQPIAEYRKPRLSEELAVTSPNIFSENDYQHYHAEFLRALESGVTGADLTGIFEKQLKPVYRDHVHFSFHKDSEGYRVMLNAMKPHLKKIGLRAK